MGKTITALLSSKRRKVSDDRTPYRSSSSTLSKLPKEPLSHVSSFLAAPSRALFAVALDLDTQDMSLFSDFRSAILGDDWGTLDFGEIEKDLAAKLCDEDVEAALVFIEASANVKRLKLTNCINITGSGLWPLRGSTIIEQIDLNVVREYESPQLDIKPPISYDAVLPILDSIINRRQECSLKYLQLPYVWRKSSWVAWKDPVEDFLERYQRRVLAQSFAVCRKRNDPRTHIFANDPLKRSCYECLEIYCNSCRMLRECDVCDKQYCTDCVKMEQCPFCDRRTCKECLSDTTSCTDCSVTMCKMCYHECNEQDSSQTRQLRQIRAHPGSASDLFGDSDSSDSESGGIDKQISAFHRWNSCYKCLKISCNGCRNGLADNGRRAFQRCGSCDKQFCNDCDKMEACPCCRKFICAACLSDNTCPGCSERACDRCLNSRQCSSCEKQFCARCSQIGRCPCCRKDTCVECLSDCASCSDCGNMMCKRCHNTCLGCSERVCSRCLNSKQCGSCKKQFCERCSQIDRCPCCFKNTCIECLSDGASCSDCSNKMCKGCLTSNQCFNCNKYVCNRGDCGGVHIKSCQNCGKDCKHVCKDCIKEGAWYTCEHYDGSYTKCWSHFCSECNEESHERNKVRKCDDCEEYFCGGHREQFVKEDNYHGNDGCEGCHYFVNHELKHPNPFQRSRELRDEITELKRMNEELKRENNELKGQTKNET